MASFCLISLPCWLRYIPTTQACKVGLGGKRQEASFKEAKGLLMSSQLLVYFNPGKTWFYLATHHLMELVPNYSIVGVILKDRSVVRRAHLLWLKRSIHSSTRKAWL